MNEKTQKLTEWAVDKIKREYSEDIALLVAIEGHSVNEDGHGECFDYFVPETARGNELAQTFIIDGIGYDLYPRSWERTECTAALDDPATLCLGNAKILYSRTKEDETRFYAIRDKLYANLSNKEYTYKKALEKLNIAMDIYRTAMFEDELYKIRKAAGYIHYYLSLAVFYLNGTFSRDWRNGRVPELMTLQSLPDGFVEYYMAILRAKTTSELKSLAHLVITSARQFILDYRPSRPADRNTPDFTALADWYQEISLWWRRLRYYCDVNNSDAAFVDACSLQSELSIVSEEFGLREMDLLGCFDINNLSFLSHRAEELEAYIISEIAGHNVELKKYDSLEDFLAQNR